MQKGAQADRTCMRVSLWILCSRKLYRTKKVHMREASPREYMDSFERTCIFLLPCE
jgi:hypothetical protein